MAISPYSGNNTIKKLGNYYVAYNSGDYYDYGVYGLISSDGQNWDRIDVLFSDPDPQVVRSVGYNPITQAIYLVRGSEYGDSLGGTLDELSSTGVHTEITKPFPSRYNGNFEIFPYDNKFRFFSGAGLLEFNTTDFQPSTADSQYLNYRRDSGQRAFIVATTDRLVRIDLDYGVYHATFANPNTWVKVASASSIDYFNANDRIEYIAYLNSEFYIHIYDEDTYEYRIVKSSNGYTSTSSDSVSGYQREPALYNAGTYLRRGTWTNTTRQFQTSTDGITWTTLSSVTGLTGGSSFGFIKYINGQYLFTHGSSTSTRVLYTTSNLTSATSSLTGGILDVAYNGSIYMAVTTGGLVYTSPDAIAWTAVTSPDFNELTLKGLHAIGADFILTDSINRAILVTRDSGVTWQRKDMPTIIDTDSGIHSGGSEDYVESGSLIFISSFSDYSGGESIYGDFVMKSDDLGDTWNYTVADLQARIRPEYFYSKVIPLNNGAVLYSRTNGYLDVSLADKLTVSQDGGVTWVTLNTGITVPDAVSYSGGVYQDLYHDGTQYILMICDSDYTSISFYSSVDLVSWQPESVDVSIAPALGGPFIVVNAPRLYILGNARLLVFDYVLYNDEFGIDIPSSVLLYSSAGYSSWQNKILYSSDSQTWVFANSTETTHPYMIGYDDNNNVYGNLQCTDLAYDAAQNRVVVLGVGVDVPSSEEPEEPEEP